MGCSAVKKNTPVIKQSSPFEIVVPSVNTPSKSINTCPPLIIPELNSENSSKNLNSHHSPQRVSIQLVDSHEDSSQTGLNNLPLLDKFTKEDSNSTIVTLSSPTSSNKPSPRCNLDSLNTSIITITVNACQYEKMYPFWIESNSQITFHVEGKWNVDNKNECDAKGIILNNEIKGEDEFNHGSLVGRVLGGEQFNIFDGVKYISKYSGPLFLKMNIRKFNCSPSGSLLLNIEGGKICQLGEIDDILGWKGDIVNIKAIDNEDCNESFQVPEFERSVVIFLNKIRCNRKLFAEEYLYDFGKLTKSTKALYDKMVGNESYQEPYEFNLIIARYIIQFYSPILDKTIQTNDKRNKILNSTEELKNYLNEKYKTKNISVFIKKNFLIKPLSLSIKFLLDNEIQKELFEGNNKEIAMVTLKTLKEGKQLCISVIVFCESDEEELIKCKRSDVGLEVISEDMEIKRNMQKSERNSIGLSNKVYQVDERTIDMDKKEINKLFSRLGFNAVELKEESNLYSEFSKDINYQSSKSEMS